MASSLFVPNKLSNGLNAPNNAPQQMSMLCNYIPNKSCSCCSKTTCDRRRTDSRETEDLLRMLESEYKLHNEDWTAEIVLPCTPMKDDIDESALHVEPDEIDICCYLNNKDTKYSRLNFSIAEYPPPKDLEQPFKGVVWEKLKTTIERASYQSNSPVICGSGSSSKKTFSCQCCNNTNLKNRSTKRLDEEYRSTHLTNDGERGERDNGKALPRRTNAQSGKSVLSHLV